ncbi:MAG: hypothetical protein NT049_15180 [Planctomycetota bacterium]|nr:hypothetical protein [Planctomycetota bacterium]
MRTRFVALLIAVVACLLLLPAPAAAQNVVDNNPAGRKAEAITLTPQDVEAMLAETPDFSRPPASPEAKRAAAKLDAHVAEFLAGFPWKAFHTTLGISGYEAYFNHPDEMFYALSIALPQLTPETATAAKKFLAEQLAKNPPYAADGLDNRAGNPREAYDVPDDIRIAGPAKAHGTLGVYALWAYCYWSQDAAAAKTHWAAAMQRMAPLLAAPYAFDIASTKYTSDEAERLTADLAGLVGFARLARMNGDAAAEAQEKAKALELLTIRVNLERTNPNILEPTKSASKHLHNSKLARYSSLVPEVARAVAQLSDGLARERIKDFREARNAWHMAFAERMTGGENYITPPHISRAMMTTSTFIEDLPGEKLLAFVDVPWCKGDLYFVEKCTYALWGETGKAWRKMTP